MGLIIFKQFEFFVLNVLPGNERELFATEVATLPVSLFGGRQCICSPTFAIIGEVIKKQVDLDVALNYIKHALYIELHAPHPNQLDIDTFHSNNGGVLKIKWEDSQYSVNFTNE